MALTLLCITDLVGQALFDLLILQLVSVVLLLKQVDVLPSKNQALQSITTLIIYK